MLALSVATQPTDQLTTDYNWWKSDQLTTDQLTNLRASKNLAMANFLEPYWGQKGSPWSLHTPNPIHLTYHY